MAFILRIANSISTCWLFAPKFNLLHNEIREFRCRILPSTAILPFKYRKFSTPTPYIMTESKLQHFIAQLDMDVRNRKRINVSDIEHILTGLKYWKNINFHHSLILLRSCGSMCVSLNPKDRTDLTHRVLSLIEESGCNVDISHYNTLLAIYLQNEYQFSPDDFLNLLTEKGLQPNKVTYHRLLKAYCQQGNISGASQILQKMKTEQISINEDVFNSLIYGHCQIGDMQGAAVVIDLMKSKGVLPTCETYVNLISGYAKEHDTEKILNIIDDCENKNLIFADDDLLRVVYFLAVNNNREIIYKLLEKLKKKAGYNSLAKMWILRLLDKNEDLIAIEVFCTLLSRKQNDGKIDNGKFLVEYIVKYRTPEKILENCKILADKGVLMNPLSSALREILITEDTSKALNFFACMKKKTLPVRGHYFWPFIIKASQEGNKKMLKTLKKMHNLGIKCCQYTADKIVFPNYKFGTEWINQLDELHNVGISKQHLSARLLCYFLNEGNLNDAETIAKTMPISVKYSTYISSFADFLKKTKNVEFLVNLMYCIIHDIHENSLTNDNEGTFDFENDVKSQGNVEVTREMNFVTQVICCVAAVVDEELFVLFLRKLLEKNMKMSPHGVKTLQVRFPSDTVEKLLRQLVETNLQCKLDDSLLKAKKRDLQNLQDSQNVLNELSFIIGLLFNENVEKAVKNMTNFLNRQPVPNFTVDHSKKFRVFLRKLADSGNPHIVQQIFDKGVNVKIVNVMNFYPVVHAYLIRNELEEATKVFCKNVLETGCTSSWSPILSKIIENENAELLQKITDTLTKVKNEEFSLSALLYQFSCSGKDKEVTKLLSTMNITQTCIHDTCSWLSKENQIKGLETLLRAGRNLSYHNKMAVYTGLLLTYINAKETSKVNDLWLHMEQENIYPTQFFLKRIKEYFERINVTFPFTTKEDGETNELQQQLHVQNPMV
ncbi:hypothetical protein RUM44_011842 [Polyplax serrata]|uniref:Leucine-rich PPR motif-containing protein, mitochondrial n=1 Tax=Polyplax serrata TaxID=468196 RepID=A0ABR1B9M7_POLSC